MKKSEAQKIRAIREYFYGNWNAACRCCGHLSETDDDGKAADLTGADRKCAVPGRMPIFQNSRPVDGKRAQPFARRDSLTDFGDLEIWIHGGVADAAGVDAANYVYTADVVDVDAVNCAETNPVNLPAVDIVIAAAIDCAVQFATRVGYARPRQLAVQPAKHRRDGSVCTGDFRKIRHPFPCVPGGRIKGAWMQRNSGGQSGQQ